MWDVIVLIPGHCRSIYFNLINIVTAIVYMYRIMLLFSIKSTGRKLKNITYVYRT